MCTPESLRSIAGRSSPSASVVVERVDRGTQLLDGAAGEVLGGLELLALPLVADLRAHDLDLHARGERVLGDAVVQLAGDPVALGVEHLALAGGGQRVLGALELLVAAARSSAWRAGLVVEPGGVVEQRGVLQGRGGLAGQDAQHRAVGVVDVPVRRRPGDEPADDAPVEAHRHVQVVVVLVAVVGAARVAGADVLDVLLDVRGRCGRVGGRARGARGRASGSSPSASANTTQCAVRCSAAASATARTSVSGPSVVRTSAAEIRSSAWITRRSRSADVAVLEVEGRLARADAGERVEVGCARTPSARLPLRGHCAAAVTAPAGTGPRCRRVGVARVGRTGRRRPASARASRGMSSAVTPSSPSPFGTPSSSARRRTCLRHPLGGLVRRGAPDDVRAQRLRDRDEALRARLR